MMVGWNFFLFCGDIHSLSARCGVFFDQVIVCFGVIAGVFVCTRFCSFPHVLIIIWNSILSIRADLGVYLHILFDLGQCGIVINRFSLSFLSYLLNVRLSFSYAQCRSIENFLQFIDFLAGVYLSSQFYYLIKNMNLV